MKKTLSEQLRDRLLALEFVMAITFCISFCMTIQVICIHNRFKEIKVEFAQMKTELQEQIKELENNENIIETTGEELKYLSQPESFEVKSKSIEEEYKELISELETCNDKEEWFERYKLFKSYNSIYIDFPESIYNNLTDEEIYLIQRVVETECYQAGFNAKVNVASVVFNRINHKDRKYGNSIYKVITSPRQFAYHRKKISEDTITAVEYAYEIGDTTGGCVGFRSDKKPNKWGKWKYVFSDNAIHHFYSE